MIKKETLQSLINSGQGYKLEFKVRIPSKVRELTDQICAFANVLNSVKQHTLDKIFIIQKCGIIIY